MRTFFTHANIVDVKNHTTLQDIAIVVEDGRIVELESSPFLDADDIEVDLKGQFVTPGLFNCHVHMTSRATNDPLNDMSLDAVNQTIVAAKNLSTYIRTGVTYVRDVGALYDIPMKLRDAVIRGDIKIAPDIQASGQPICITGGTTWNFVGYQADGENECRKAARLMIRQGADWIKLMGSGGVSTHGVDPNSPQLSEEELRAAVTEAHNFGKKACCHCQNIKSAQNAIRAGVDCIEHGHILDDETIRMMLDHGTWLVATLAAPYCIYHRAQATSKPDFVEKASRVLKHSQKDFIKAYRAGVPCAMATDCGTPSCLHDQTSLELILMVENCGLSPYEALEIGTINSAKLLGVDKDLGSIEVGKLATFAVFAEDPIANIHATEKCRMTVKKGNILWDSEKFNTLF